MLQASPNLVRFKWREAELGATRLQGRDDLVNVVADHAEPGVFGVLLDDLRFRSKTGHENKKKR